MRISKSAYKRLSILLTVVMLVTMLAPMASAATGVSAVTLVGPSGTITAGSNVTLTANATGASSTTKYYFWVRNAQGAWVGYPGDNSGNTLTLTGAQGGTYVVQAYADGVASNKVYFMVGSSATVSASIANGQITATATAANVTNPMYDFWVKDPSGTWSSVNQHFVFTNTCTIPAAAAGTYTVVANVTDMDFYQVLGTSAWNSNTFVQGSATANNALSVQSVSAIDATHVKATFNMAVNKAKAETIANYAITDTTGTTGAPGLFALASATGSAASLSTDGLTVTITVGTNVTGGLANAPYYLILNNNTGSANDIATTTGAVLPKTSVAFTGNGAADTTPPVVSTVTYNGTAGTLAINFSESVKTATLDLTKFTVTDGTTSLTILGSDTTAWTNGNSTVTVTLAATEVSAINALGATRTLSAAANAVKDLANNALTASTGTSLGATATLSSAAYDAQSNVLTLTFSKAVKVSTLATSQLTLSSSAGAWALGNLDVINTTADGTTAAITLSTNNTPTFMTGFEAASATSRTVSLANAAGNFVATTGEAVSAANNVAVSFTADTTAPTLVSAFYNNTGAKLTLTFSEPVAYPVNGSAASATFATNAVTVTNGSVNNGNSATVASFTLDPADNDQVVANVSGVTNYSRTLTFTAATGGTATNLATVGTANLVCSPSSKIYFPVGTFIDTVGNQSDALTSTNAVAISYTSQDVPYLNVANATQISPTQATISFGRKVDATTAQNVANYAITGNGATLPVSAAQLLSDGTTVMLTTSTAVTSGYNYTITVTGVNSLYGVPINNTPPGGSFYQATWTATGSSSTAAPAISSVRWTDSNSSGTLDQGDLLTINFANPIVNNGAVIADFTANNGHIFGNSTVASGSSSNQLVITLGTTSTVVFGDTVTLAATVHVKSLTGIAADGTANAAITSTDTTAATPLQILTAVYNDQNSSGTVNAGDYITVTVNKDLNRTLTPVTGDFTPAVNTTLGVSPSFSILDNRTIRITLGTNPCLDSSGGGANYLKTAPTLALIAAPAGVKDLFNNTTACSTVAAAVTSADTAPPTLTAVNLIHPGGSGVVNVASGDTIQLVFSENVGIPAGATLTNNEISFYQGTTQVQSNSTTGAFTVSGNTVSYVLPNTDAIVGNAVSSYTSANIKAGMTNIYDASGNMARPAVGYGLVPTVRQQ